MKLPTSLLRSCTLILFCSFFLFHSADAQTSVDEGVILQENFDDQVRTGKLKLSSATIARNSAGDGSLQLPQGSFAELDSGQRLYADKGSLSFWVKPLWVPGDTQSHTFLSLRWDDKKNSYLAISLGWWEPTGSRRLYFILSNQEFVHCSAHHPLDNHQWSMITVVWKGGTEGYCKLYVNAELVGNEQKAFRGNYVNKGPIFIGTDLGATDRRNRIPNFMFDDLTIWNHPLSDEAILQRYREEDKDPGSVDEKEWRWLTNVLQLPSQQRRNSKGVLLENRVIFDPDIRWATSEEATDRILSRIKAAGFNVYVPCVWTGKGTYYPSEFAPPDPRLTKITESREDPLAYLIEKAHNMGLEVHPWFMVVRRETDQYPEFYGEGVPEEAFNVHLMEFRRFITRLMLDVVRRYDVDGVNLDYIRTMGICTAQTCKENYREKTGQSLMQDYYLRIGAARARIQKWQDAAVGDIVSSFAQQARQLKPELIISVDAHPVPPTTIRPLDGRDTLGWVAHGWVDVIFNMDYKKKFDYQNHDAVLQHLKSPGTAIMLLGNYDQGNRQSKAIARSGDVVAKYASFAQRKWPGAGVAFYLYNLLTDGQINALRNGPFAEDAIPSWRRPSGRRPARVEGLQIR